MKSLEHNDSTAKDNAQQLQARRVWSIMLFTYALTIRARGANILCLLYWLKQLSVVVCSRWTPGFVSQRGNFTPKYGIGVESCQRNLFWAT